MSINIVTIEADRIIVEPQGLNKLWSFKGRLDIPLSHVTGATFDPGIVADAKGMRSPGLAVPGKYAGTFVHDDELSFWNVSGSDHTVVIQLADEHYDRLVLTADDPKDLVDRLNAAIG